MNSRMVSMIRVRHSDAEGNLKNWWTADDRKNFEALAKKYIDYFSSLEPFTGLQDQRRSHYRGEHRGPGRSYPRVSRTGEIPQRQNQHRPARRFYLKQRFFLGWHRYGMPISFSDAGLRNQIQTDCIVLPVTALMARCRIWRSLRMPGAAALTAKWYCRPHSVL